MQLHHTQALAHVREYTRAIYPLTLSTPIAPSHEIKKILCLLHPLVEVGFPPFIDDFHPKTKVTLDWEEFIFVLARSPRLSFGDP
jgi:hypothetical protein